jgi:hypothetical protein
MNDKIKSTSQFDIQVQVRLTEEEARALEALTVYGTKVFLEHFYKLGKSYLGPHEKGLISLFETIKEELPRHLGKADDVRDIWRGDKVATPIITTQNHVS